MNASTPIADLRRDYKMASLDAQDLAAHPVDQFARWFEQALAAQVPEPNAMTLATVTAQNRPSARIVLLKGFDHEGFTFFTNYESRKGEELASHPHACLVFNWLELERQVRIEGRVEKVSEAESDAYFKIRPLASRYGAWASPQSRVIADRQVLIDREASLRPQYGEDPPRPGHWGGYRVKPEQLEFWQGRRSRLHDRFRYSQSASPGAAPWLIERLAP